MDTLCASLRVAHISQRRTGLPVEDQLVGVPDLFYNFINLTRACRLQNEPFLHFRSTSFATRDFLRLEIFTPSS